jgi:hypothetical protein
MWLPSLLIAVIIEISVIWGAFVSVIFSFHLPLTVLVSEVVGLAFLFEGILTGWYRNYSIIPIPELEKRAMYQIEKKLVSKIEFNRNLFRPSHIVITTSAGERFSILFAEGGSFDRVKRAIQT